MSTSRWSPARAGRLSGWAAGLLVGSAAAQSAQPPIRAIDESISCSPPARVDLQLERIDPPGQPAWAGSTGTLTFRVTRRAGSMFTQQFGIAHELEPLPFGDQQTLALAPVDTACWFNAFVGPGPVPGFFGLHYYVQGLLQPAPELTATCRLRYDVLTAARRPEQIRFRLRPLGCAIDPNMADNLVEFAFGGLPPAVAVPGPQRGWLLLAAGVLLAMAAVRIRGRSRRRRRVGAMVAPSPPVANASERNPTKPDASGGVRHPR